MKLFQTEDFYDPNKSQRRNSEKFVLKPDPIMALDRILGVHPRHHSGLVYYNKDAKLSSELLYSQANCLIGYHNKLQKQRLLLDPTIGEIQKFLIIKSFAITVSHQLNGKTLKSGAPGTDILITVWCLETAKVVMSVKPPLQVLRNLTMSSDNVALCMSGKDAQGRELILVYSF